MRETNIARRFGSAIIEKAVSPFLRYTQSVAFGERLIQSMQSAIRQELDSQREKIAITQPDNPIVFGYKVYSQVDEDGIIQEIFRRIPSYRKTFVEIGSGDGSENNTHYLALLGWRGVWIDGDPASMSTMRSELGGLDFDSLVARQMFVSTDNVHEVSGLYRSLCKNEELGFFSIDIDGNDLPVLLAFLTVEKPLVVCVEYNAKFLPPFSIGMPYEANFRWNYDDYHGASLQACCDALTGYKLVCCNVNGANAFFVRNDVAGGFRDYSPSELYQPLRLNLSTFRPHHAPSMKWLRNALNGKTA